MIDAPTRGGSSSEARLSMLGEHVARVAYEMPCAWRRGLGEPALAAPPPTHEPRGIGRVLTSVGVQTSPLCSTSRAAARGVEGAGLGVLGASVAAAGLR